MLLKKKKKKKKNTSISNMNFLIGFQIRNIHVPGGVVG